MEGFENNLARISTIKLDSSNAGIRKSSKPSSPGRATAALTKTKVSRFSAHDPGNQPFSSNDGALSVSSFSVDKESKEGIANTGLKVGTSAKELRQAKDQSEKIQKVNQDAQVNAGLFVSGWGKTEKGSGSKTLMRTQLKIVQESRCKETDLLVEKQNPDSLICTVGADFKSNTCNGDSGGPIYTESSGGYTLIGLVSYGRSGCEVSEKKGQHMIAKPSVQTRVHFFQDFINSAIKRLQAKP
jgi:secreted trypsin-like serine protease